MAVTPLRVRPCANAMVQDYAALGAFMRRYIGWRHDPALGTNGGFVFEDKLVELSGEDAHVTDYLRHLRVGDLLPADAATARRAGLSFKEPEA